MSPRHYQASEIVGINPIAAVPFTARGALDLASFERMLQHLQGTGINGLTLFGIASEFAKLSDAERDLLAGHFVRSLAGGALYRVLSVTEHSTELAVQRALRYQLLGADALMLLPPFFLKPAPEAIQAHIAAVLDAVHIPVLVQYAPNETGMPITPAAMAQIAQRWPHAVFKIECNPPVNYVREFLQLAPGASVLNGYAGLYMPDILAVGGKGVMPGCSFAELYVEIHQLWQSGQHAAARQRHQQLLPFIQRWMSHPEYIIQVEKTILQRRGIINTDYCRHPGWPLHAEDTALIDTFLRGYGL